MPDNFFTSWELWQQMTFALALAIVAVFCAGLGKMWWNNRLMKKQEAVDVEKRARIEELRKTGLPTKRANPVPFGVRAIQSGIEVDGIWISKPGSFNELGDEVASSTTPTSRDSDSRENGRRIRSGDGGPSVTSTGSLEPKKPGPSSYAPPMSQRFTEFDSAESVTPPLSQSRVYQIKKQSCRPVGTLDQDTMRRLEGKSPLQPHFATCVPTSSPSRQNPLGALHRNRESSSADSVGSQPCSFKSASRGRRASSHSSKPYRTGPSVPRPQQMGRGSSGLHRWPKRDSRDASEMPARRRI